MRTGFAHILFMAAISLAASMSPAYATQAPDPRPERISIGEGGGKFNKQQDDRIILQRFADYKALGVGNIRLSFNWAEMEYRGQDSATAWRADSETLEFMRLAKQNGIHLRLNVNAMRPPKFMLDELGRSGALMKNGRGDYSPTLSYWYPGVQQLVEEKTARLFEYLAENQLLDGIAYLIVPMGPAAEPIYPAAWMAGYGKGSETTFWFHDQNARNDFVAQMRKTYKSISGANTAWGTNYRDWSEVDIPAPGTRTGPMWRDVLVWYRDSKRRFIAWQIQHYKRLVEKYYPRGARPQLVLLVTGDRLTEAEWDSAIRRGDGNQRIKTMIDHEFLIDIAHEQGLMLQQGGIQDEKSIASTRQYMAIKGYDILLWGENNRASKENPDELVNVAINQNLYGMEFLHASDLYEPNGKKTRIFDRLALALDRYKRHLQLQPPARFRDLVSRSCNPKITGGPTGNAAQRTAFAYCLVLDRAATPNEIARHAGLKGGASGQTSRIAQALFGSAEFEQRFYAAGLNNTDFVTLVYQLLMGRNPNEAEFRASMTALVSGAEDRAAVFNRVLKSALGAVHADLYIPGSALAEAA